MERSLTKVTVKVKLDIQSFWNFFNLYENFKKAVRNYLFTFATFALKEKKNTDLDFSMLPDDRSSAHGTHMVEGEDGLLQVACPSNPQTHMPCHL